MNYFSIYLIILWSFMFNFVLTFGLFFGFRNRMNHTETMSDMSKKTKCLNPPRTAKKVETNIQLCQEEVKNKIILDALGLLREELEHEHEHEHHDDEIEDSHVHHESPEENLHTDVIDHSSQIQDVIEHSQIQDGFDFPHLEDYKQHHHHHDIRKRSFSYHPTLVPSEDKRIAGCLLHCVYAKNNAIDKLGWPTLDGLVNFYSEGVNEHGFFMATLRSVNLCLKAATHKYNVNRHRLPEKGESCDLAFDVFDCISDQITAYCLDHYTHD